MEVERILEDAAFWIGHKRFNAVDYEIFKDRIARLGLTDRAYEKAIGRLCRITGF